MTAIRMHAQDLLDLYSARTGEFTSSAAIINAVELARRMMAGEEQSSQNCTQIYRAWQAIHWQVNANV